MGTFVRPTELRPEGTIENSPAIHRWVPEAEAIASPIGTTETFSTTSAVPTGLEGGRERFPSSELLAYSRIVPTGRNLRARTTIPAPSRQSLAPRAFTLVEMLVAMAITLVMMAAVVTLFANVSNSVRNRRATIVMTNQLRHVRNTLQQDLQGATCPGVTWQRPESNHGYIELIEGIQNDQNPTGLVRDLNGDGDYDDVVGGINESQLSPGLSPIPRNNIGADGADGTAPNGEITTRELEAHYKRGGSFVPGGLGDHDDILMLTVRNEQEPFVGRTPKGVRDSSGDTQDFGDWGYDTIESPLAEVVWFCVENPSEADNDNVDKFFGEPGIRTIYRRTLLIAPWVNPYRFVDNNGEQPFDVDGNFKAEPGLVRMLGSGIDRDDVSTAIASIVAFQDKYDLSVRLEWDHNIGRWKIMANTLADLTKRENRFGHFGFAPGAPERAFPFSFVSIGRGYSGSNVDVDFMVDPDIGGSGAAQWEANISATGGAVESYSPATPGNLGIGFLVRPFAFIEDAPGAGGVPATANAMLNDQGQVVRVTLGPVPLWGSRRGQDVMMTEVLGFDVRVYDPGAPLYGRRDVPGDPNSPLTVLQPSDPGWKFATHTIVGSPWSSSFEFMGQGAYVDMGYAFGVPNLPSPPSPPFTVSASKSWTLPWFAQARGVSDIYGILLTPGYSVYDTWSFHYENNGVNEDNDNNTAGQPLIDEGTNGLDDPGVYWNPATLSYDIAIRLGPDDVGERETVPPYDKPLRGVQVLIRTYELDSRAIRQVRVNQHFLPE
jgi:prepilin-type N-terminal cleavage/methylation domain-containing protein